MPDRILRDELLTSDRWLLLQRNTHRLAFVCLIPKADALGNMEAGDGDLWRVWHEALRLDSRQTVPEILEALVAADLVRLYARDGKRYLHIPRYRQRLRYLGGICPPSPWTNDEEKQRLNIQFTGRQSGEGQALTSLSPAEVKRSEEKKSIKTRARRSARVNIPDDFKVSDRVVAWALDHGYDRLEQHLAHFVGYAKANGKSYADWDQAFMNAIRDNWAKLPPRESPQERRVAL